jgi:hypothetical protein
MSKKKKDDKAPETSKVPEQTNAPADTNETEEDKLDINKSIFQTNRELREKRQRELEEQQAIVDAEIAEREKKKREAYDRKIREEHIELMRLKQGLIEESETIHEEHEEEIKLTFRKKVANFFYHNKWWLGIGICCACIGGFLIYNLLTKPNPDMVVLVIADNEELGSMSELKEYIEGFAEDSNGNGKTEVSIYYIPYSDNDYRNYADGADTKMSTQLQSADSIIVLGGKKLDELLGEDAKNEFVDLEEIYPDNPHVTGYKFMLKDTDIGEKIKVGDDCITDDLYLTVRRPSKLLYSSQKAMQKTYDKDWPVFEKIVEDLS